MIRILLTLLVAVTFSLRPALAQTALDTDQVWVQIEAQPSLNQAMDAARDYASRMPDVNGFALGSGWYAIALGPYDRETAGSLLRNLRARGIIPRDSYIGFASNYRDRFYPVGGGATISEPAVTPAPGTSVETTEIAPAPEAMPETAPETAAEATPVPTPEATAPAVTPPAPVVAEPAPAPALPEETRAEAYASEALLTRAEREELQVAMADSGHYTSVIDGAFGRGTRNAMASWQAANGYEVTGVLTSRQRAALRQQYYAILEGLDMQRVEDARAGIAMNMPTGLVAFDRYEAPFAHYEATDGGPQKVVLISQEGTQDTLFGLYDILQTLAIVPVEGERSRGDTSFVIEGANSQIVTHVSATLEAGQIKGFILVWPVGDEARRSRMLSDMRASLTRLPGVLDAAAGADAGQTVDLVSGLQVRRPEFSQSGFFVDGAGAVVTAAAPLAACGRVTIDFDHEASIAGTDASGRVALLRPADRLAPMQVAALAASPARLQSDVALSGYSYEGVLGAPTLTFGQLADMRGLDGEAGVNRLALESRPGDAGGPVLDATGSVVGMMLPAADGSRQLPADVSFAMDLDSLKTAIREAGASSAASTAMGIMPPEDLTTLASGMTALVSCWK